MTPGPVLARASRALLLPRYVVCAHLSLLPGFRPQGCLGTSGSASLQPSGQNQFARGSQGRRRGRAQIAHKPSSARPAAAALSRPQSRRSTTSHLKENRYTTTTTLRESKRGETTGGTAQKQHVGGHENREGPSGRWDGSPHTPRLPLAPAPAAPHWSTSPRSSRAGIVTCVARVGGLPNCTVAI